MATKAKIAANERRKVVAARYAQRRAELKAVLARPSSTDDARAAAAAELRRQPRDASRTRIRNRDSTDG
ncbi:MAG: 30S ribosomal protein S14, partial [Pseudonocardia sediminis]